MLYEVITKSRKRREKRGRKPRRAGPRRRERQPPRGRDRLRITSYNVCYTKLLRWTREEGTLFEEPFKDREVFPELEAPPKGSVAKEELRDLAGRVRSQVGRLLAGRDDRNNFV